MSTFNSAQFVGSVDAARGLGVAGCIVRAIRWYQRRVSPYFGPRCRFHPTCSAFALGAVEKHGALRGGVMGVWRLLRCNQFSSGGIDDVPDSFRLSFRAYDGTDSSTIDQHATRDVAGMKE